MIVQSVMTVVNLRRVAIAAALMSVLSSTGCSRNEHCIPDHAPARPSAMYQSPAAATDVPERTVERPRYRIAPGDQLEIIYHVKNIPTPGGYKLKIEDRVKIQFPFQEELNQTLTVGSDGKIRCLLNGDVVVMGLTTQQVEDKLRETYSKSLREPELTVTVEAANVKIAELKKAITTAPRGQSRLVPVKPDGTIDLPYIGQVMAASKTVDELKHELDGMYAKNELEEIEVTAQLLEFAKKRFFVMGEVLSPGPIESSTPLSLFQAIISAGGPNTRADQSNVLVVRRDMLPLPEAVVVDMNDLLERKRPGPGGYLPDGSGFRHDLYLADGDIVFVPPSGMAKANDWIDQVFTRGIRSVLPYSANVGLNYSYELRSAPVTVKNKQIGWPSINTQLGP